MKTITLLSGLALWICSMNSAPCQSYAFSTLAGVPGESGCTDGPGQCARFCFPHGIAVDRHGVVYVADTCNHTIRQITRRGTHWMVSTIAGAAGCDGCVDGAGESARFCFPFGITVDILGRLYVTDTYNCTVRQIKKVGCNWVVTTIAGAPGQAGTTDGSSSRARLAYPQGIAEDGLGNLYLADYATIRKLSRTGRGWQLRTIAGSPTAWGNADGCGSAARFYAPCGVAVDRFGRVYVADQGNHVLRRLRQVRAGWEVSTIAGQAGASGLCDGCNSAARFCFPAGLAVDRCGNLFVSDYANCAIREIQPLRNDWFVRTLCEQDGPPALNYPQAVAVDRAGRLYLADTASHSIGLGLLARCQDQVELNSPDLPQTSLAESPAAR